MIGFAGCSSGGDGGDGGDGGSTGGGLQDVTLTVGDFFPENHITAQNALMHFTNEVESRTDGRVTFDIFWDGQLGPADQQTSLIQNQTADMGPLGGGFESSVIPLSNALALPGTFTSAVEGNRRGHEFIQNDVYDYELKGLGLKPLFTGLPAPYQAMTVDPKIESLEDWKGLNIRSGGGMQSIAIEALGGTAVENPGMEQYQALARGTVDGTVVPIPSIPVYDLQDHLNYSTTNIHLGTFTVIYTMNQDVWDGLADETKQVMTEVGLDASLNLGEAQDASVEENITSLGEQGMDMYEIEESEAAEWASILLDETGSTWLEQVDDPNAEAVLNTWTGYWS